LAFLLDIRVPVATAFAATVFVATSTAPAFATRTLALIACLLAAIPASAVSAGGLAFAFLATRCFPRGAAALLA